jgi:peptidylprolyl isomerase
MKRVAIALVLALTACPSEEKQESREPAPVHAQAVRFAPSAQAVRTTSGLLHEPLSPATSEERAAPHDRVRVRYVGRDANGREFDNSKGRGEHAELVAGEGFPGFREALQLLRMGEKRRFFIPEELAFKHYPGPVHGDLIYDIELVDIVRMPAPPAVPEDLAKPTDAAQFDPELDFAQRTLMRGIGKDKPRGDSSGLDVHYTCWNREGERVVSTIPSGHPYRAELNKLDLMPGLAEAVRTMTVGEKRRLWLPPRLTAHEAGARKGVALVCDLELVALYENKRLVDSAP